jgi:hypothetical protein
MKETRLKGPQAQAMDQAISFQQYALARHRAMKRTFKGITTRQTAAILEQVGQARLHRGAAR